MGKYFNNKQQAYKRQKALNRRDADKLLSAAHEAYILIGLLVLNQEFGFGKKRAWRFLTKFNNQLECYNQGYISLDDIKLMVKEDIGLEVVK